MDEQLAGLQTLTAARRSKLEESIKLHQYIRDVDEVVSWLKEKETVASSNDYGKDFDHLLVIISQIPQYLTVQRALLLCQKSSTALFVGM